MASSNCRVEHPRSATDTSSLKPQFPRPHCRQPRDALVCQRQAAAARAHSAWLRRTNSETHLSDDVTPVCRYLNTRRKQRRRRIGLGSGGFTEHVLDGYCRKWRRRGLDAAKQTIVHWAWKHLNRVTTVKQLHIL